MVVRPVVLQDPPKYPFPLQLPFNNSSRSISPLESALTQVLILRHLKSFRINTYTKPRGRAPLEAPKFVNSLRPPTTPKPTISATVTSPPNPSLSIDCGHFPSPIGVGVQHPCQTSSLTLSSCPKAQRIQFPHHRSVCPAPLAFAVTPLSVTILSAFPDEVNA